MRSNTATATPATPDPDPTNNTSAPGTRPQVGPSSADLSSTKTVLENAVSPGLLFTYRISVANAGPSAARDVTLTDSLPTPLAFVHATAGCSAAGQVVRCTRSAIPPGVTAVFDILVRLDPMYSGNGSDIVNTASITSVTPDPNPGNDNPAPTQAPPIRSGEADLTITKTGPSGPLPSGGEIAYTIVVTNQGPDAASEVVIQDPTAGLTFIATAGDCTTAFPCALGTIPAGQAKTMTVRDAVPSNVAGVITNTATVSSFTPDPTLTNNTATAQTPNGPANVLPGRRRDRDVLG